MKNQNIPNKGTILLPVGFTYLEKSLMTVCRETFKQLFDKKTVKEIPRQGNKHFFIYSDKRLFLVVNGVFRQGEKKDQGCMLVLDTACSYQTSQSNAVWFSSIVDPMPLKEKFCYAATKEMFDDTRCVLDEVSIVKVISNNVFAFTRQKQHINPVLNAIRENNLAADFVW